MNSLYTGTRFSRLLTVVLLFSATILFSVNSSAQFSIEDADTDYTQNFNSLTPAGAWSNNTTLSGWYARTTNTASITAFALGTGTTTSAGFYSFASTPTSDRALGFVTTNAYTGSAGSANNYMAWRMVNNTGQAITSVTISYRGEQYRNNGNTSAHSLLVSYRTGSSLTDVTASGFTSVPALTFTSPVATGSAAAVDGNVAGMVPLSATIDLSSSPLADGSEIMIRWMDLNDANNDHTLAIDDVTVSVEVAAASGNDNLSDIVADGTFTAPANIDYASHQEVNLTSSSLEIARFIIRDGAGSADGDAVGTILNGLNFSVTNGGVIRRLAIYDGTTEVAEIAGGASAVFSGLDLTAGDGGTKTFSLRASFNASVTDNTQFSYTISSASTDPEGSGFESANAGAAASSTTGNNNRIEVTASKLIFSTQPISALTNVAMANVVVQAVDALDNRDLDYSGTFSITSTGSLVSSPVQQSTSNGQATFSTLTHSATGTGLTLHVASGVLTLGTSNTFNILGAPIMAWDVTGASAPATFAATALDPNLSSASGASNITRGPGASASAGGNSFRTTGFQNNGISTSNTDYFQVTVVPNPGYRVSLSAIDANFNGTGTYAASPGVSNQFAYSLDGTSYTLIGSPSVTIGVPASMPQIDLSGIPALQNVAGTIYLRYYASGQTGTGGWGFYSASSGTNGLAISGEVNGMECNDPSACNYTVEATSGLDCTYAELYYIDADGDGYASGTETTCTPGLGYTTSVLPVTDCDDTHDEINPDATEVACNGIDDDCDTSIDEGSVTGCQDPDASNYNPSATCPGSCTYGGAWSAGNLVLLRGGNGVDNLPASGSSAPVFLEQITTSGSTVSVFPMTTASGTQLSQSIGSTAEGFITRTPNGDAIIIAGYNEPAGVANVTSAGVGAERVANQVDVDYAVSRLFESTSIHSASNIRSATKAGNHYWTSGSNQGINYAGSGTPAIISTTITNTRVVQAFNGDLYFSTGSGTNKGIHKIANGLATSGSNASTLIVNMGASASPYDFVFSPSGTTIYVADDNNSAAGGVYKYTFNGSSWNEVAHYTISGYPSVSSIAVDFTSATATIYAVSRSTTQTIVVSFADNDASGAVAHTTLKQSTSATAIYRSVKFVPCNGTTWYRDADGDGYGDASQSYTDCTQPYGYVSVAGDCNDAVATIYPGATEICNGQDDDCDVTIDESCINPPSNDNRASAPLLAGSSFPTCGNTQGNLLSATSSPEATSTEPSGAGQDVWYRFVAQSNGVRIQATNTSGLNDLVIELQHSSGTVIGIEDENDGGNEILAANNLIPGDTYYVAVRNFNPSTRGTFGLCIQHLKASSPNNGTSFNSLCSYIKSTWTGASLYAVTFDDGVNPTISASHTSTQIPFTWMPGLLYNTTYDVTFTTTYYVNDAAGNQTTVVVNSTPFAVTILPHVPVELRAADSCPATRTIGSFIGTNAVVCGASDWEWELEQVDGSNNPIGIEGPMYVETNSSSRYLRTSLIPGIAPGNRYRVRVRPLFANGAGQFAAGYQYLCIAGSAGITEPDGHFEAAVSGRLTNADTDAVMQLYPNPNRGDVFNLRAGGIVNEEVFVRIMDITGREVYSNGFAVDGMLNVTIQLAEKLNAGMYMVEMTDGSDRFVQRMIVE